MNIASLARNMRIPPIFSSLVAFLLLSLVAPGQVPVTRKASSKPADARWSHLQASAKQPDTGKEHADTLRCVQHTAHSWN